MSQAEHGQDVPRQVSGGILSAFDSVRFARSHFPVGASSCFSAMDCKNVDVCNLSFVESERKLAAARGLA